MNQSVVFLLDISALFWRLWHASGSKERGWAVDQCIGRCMQLAREYELFAIAADSARSTWRHKLIEEENAKLPAGAPPWPSYKGTRADKDAVAVDELARLLGELRKTNFTIWQVDGFEADDLIATATKALAARGARVFIGGGDKDLCQLVTDSVTFVRLFKNGEKDTLPDQWGPNEVQKKFGVWPHQIPEYLAIAGDTGDNLPHVKGLGETFAVQLLTAFDSLLAVWKHSAEGWAGVEKPPTEAARAKLKEGETTIRLAYRMASLRFDAPIDVTQLRPWEPRAETSAAPTAPSAPSGAEVIVEQLGVAPSASAATAAQVQQQTQARNTPVPPAPEQPKAMPLLDQIADATKAKAAAEGWIGRSFQERLEPRTARDAWWLAQTLDRATVPGKRRDDPPRRMYERIGNAEAIYAVITKAAELNIPSMLGLAHIRPVEGKVEVDAMLMIALALRSGRVEYVRCIESTDDGATYETKHVSAPTPQRITFGEKEAKKAGLIPADDRSPWTKYRRVMFRWRAASELLRMVCPEAVAGLYVRGEIEELDEEDVNRALKAEAA